MNSLEDHVDSEKQMKCSVCCGVFSSSSKLENKLEINSVEPTLNSVFRLQRCRCVPIQVGELGAQILWGGKHCGRT